MKRDVTGKFVNNWESETKHRVSISLTSTAWRSLDQEAQRRKISRSEIIEQFARGLEVENSNCPNGANAEISRLQKQISEQQQEIAALKRQQQELESQLSGSSSGSIQAPDAKIVTILESITDAFVAFDRNWRYTYVNEAAAQILNKTPEELIGRHVWHEVFPELEGGVAYQAMHQALAEQVPIAWDEYGEMIQCWVEVNAYPSAEGLAVYFRDVSERKQAEVEREQLLLELEQERARFEAVLQQMPAGVLIADAPSGKLVLANDQAKQILNYGFEPSYELEDYASITPFQAYRLDGELYASHEYPLVRSLKTGEIVVCEEMELCQDGRDSIIIAVNSTPVLDKQKQIQAAVVIFQDITERKQTEAILRQQTEALEGQQKWLQAVLDLMPTPTVFIEPGTAKITFTNRIANELAGGDLPKNKSIDEYADTYYCTDRDGKRIPTEQMPAVLIAQGERLENYEMNWYTPGGIRSTLCWGEILPAMHGHSAIGIGMFQDVTSLKQIEEHLRQTEERLQLALSSAQMVAWDVDLLTNQVVCSPNAQAVWGLQVGTLDEFYAVIYPEDRQSVRQSVEQAIEGNLTYAQEYRVIASNGEDCWLKSQGRVYLDGAGRAIRMVGVSVDITERKQIEAERDRLLKQEQNARWLAENERQRLRTILMQVPAMFAVLTGPDHVFELANSTFLKISGRSETIIGLTTREAFPEMEGQGFFEIHDRVYQTGEIVQGSEFLSRWDPDGNGNWTEGFFNLVFLPLKNIDGQIDSVLIHGIEVTNQVRARQQVETLLEKLQQKERQQQFLIELNDAARTIQDSNEIIWQVVSTTGQHFNVTRCTYGEIDPTQEYVIVDRDYCKGVVSVVGAHHLDSFGPDIIAELKQGKTIVVNNVDSDPRTAGVAAAFNAIQTKSLLCVPLVKAGKFVALLVLHHIVPRQWTAEDVALMERISEKTWLAVERSRVEEKLRESEAHLQLAVRIGRMGTWDWNIQTGAMLWSEGHYTVLGLQPNECKPMYEVWAAHVHPDDLPETEAKLQRAMQERTEYHHEYRVIWSDGSTHWIESRGQFTYDAQGHPKHSIGAVIDMTERKQVEQEREHLLKRERAARTQAENAQRQLATIFDTSPLGLALLDDQQRYIAINEALAEINGLSREQHLGTSIAELFGESDPRLVEVFHQIYTTGEPFISPSFAIQVPGRSDRRPGYYNVYYLPTVNSHHQVESVLVYVVDVTERIWLERTQHFLSEASAVLASSLDYQTTLEQVAQLAVPELADWCTVHIVEEDGAIDQIAVAHIDPAKLEWAHQIQEKYPLDPEAERGAAFTLRTGLSDFVSEIPDEMLVHAARDSEHLEILRQVGFSSFMCVPLRTQARILGVISFISAESGRRYTPTDVQLAEELAHRASLAIENAQLYQIAQRDRSKAEAANRIKDEFLAVLSHELRSPLNPILGWTRLLRTKRLDAMKTDQALETIERNAKLQAQLIEDLLDVSRILQGKMTLNITSVNLAVVIEAALETVRLAAEAKHIQIQSILEPISGNILGDANRLQQIVWNLLSNAVKFTQPGGQVVIKLEQAGMYAQIQVKELAQTSYPTYLTTSGKKMAQRRVRLAD